MTKKAKEKKEEVTKTVDYRDCLPELKRMVATGHSVKTLVAACNVRTCDAYMVQLMYSEDPQLAERRERVLYLISQNLPLREISRRAKISEGLISVYRRAIRELLPVVDTPVQEDAPIPEDNPEAGNPVERNNYRDHIVELIDMVNEGKTVKHMMEACNISQGDAYMLKLMYSEDPVFIARKKTIFDLCQKGLMKREISRKAKVSEALVSYYKRAYEELRKNEISEVSTTGSSSSECSNEKHEHIFNNYKEPEQVRENDKEFLEVNERLYKNSIEENPRDTQASDSIESTRYKNNSKGSEPSSFNLIASIAEEEMELKKIDHNYLKGAPANQYEYEQGLSARAAQIPEYDTESPDYLAAQMVYKAMVNIQSDIPDATPVEVRIKVMSILSDTAQSLLNASDRSYSAYAVTRRY